MFGYRLSDKVKKRDDNVVGVRKDVRTKMRVLAHLHEHFISLKASETILVFENIKDMFNIEHFELLKEAIEAYTTTETKVIKPALKRNLP